MIFENDISWGFGSLAVCEIYRHFIVTFILRPDFPFWRKFIIKSHDSEKGWHGFSSITVIGGKLFDFFVRNGRSGWC